MRRPTAEIPGGRSSPVPLLGALLALLFAPGESRAQGWAGYGANPQHTAQGVVASQLPQRIRWSMPVDEDPPFRGDDLLIHYASPLITRKNSVIVTTRSEQGFKFRALRGQDGAAIWPQPLISDFVFAPHNWIPVCGPTLVLGGQKLAIPGAGGTVYLRTNPDRGTGVVSRVSFYGIENYTPGTRASFNATVFICTPITADSAGNLYFGFAVTGTTPVASLRRGGLARISSTGQGSWISAADATADITMQKVVMNCAPALSNDERTVYVAVNNRVAGNNGFGVGYLVALDSQTLATRGKVRLKDVRSGLDAFLPDDGSGSPTIGPDGDVYFGVLENPFATNNARGWMLHFPSDIAATPKTPGSFGWDNTPSIVPSAAVPSYAGESDYLLLTKYNDYKNFGKAEGVNKLAVLDPEDTQIDSRYGNFPVPVMKEILTVEGVTPDGPAPAVREWCINSAAVDATNKCAIVNNEDGMVYRWDLRTNTLSPGLVLAAATGEAYTPTAIGPDGAVYAINRAVLNCCVAFPPN